jgi:osmotically-inducible protein OsmY
MKKRSPTGKNTDRAFAELSWDPSIHAAQIGVEAKDGIVTLAGHVSSYSDKWNAERTAQRVSGIRAITVEIDVKLPGSSKRTDVDVANSVENALVWATDLLQGNLKVIVENGWVTLGGNVDWDYQRQSAASAIRHLTGVRGVSCDIAVKPKVSMSDVKSDIEAALKRRAISESQKIIVAVDGSSITLSGTAHSWSERELATHSVWGTPGVQHVVNEITVLN